MGQKFKHIRICSLDFFTCMVDKRLLLISQGRLEPSENFAIKLCNLIKFLGILSDLKGVIKLSKEAKISCVWMW
jgi:hypothetical protein